MLGGKPRRVIPQAPRAAPLPMAKAPPPPALDNPRQVASDAHLRDLIRTFWLNVSQAEQGGEQVVTVSRPAMLKVVEAPGLYDDSDTFTARLSARPTYGFYTDTGGQAEQVAVQRGSLFSQRSTIYLPARGEWLIHLEFRSGYTVDNYSIATQIFEDVSPAQYAAITNTDRPSDVKEFRTTLIPSLGSGQSLLLSKALNSFRTALYVSHPSQYSVGDGGATFPMVAGEYRVIETAMQSIIVTGNALNNTTINGYTFLE